MKIIRHPKVLQKEMDRLRQKGKSIGFVPTMGALHEGHLTLVRQAKRQNDEVVVSIFVNPTQFGPREDFRKYPRTIKADSRLLQKENTNYLFLPEVTAMYPEGSAISVDPGVLAQRLCGKFRPGHFRGVATIVAKLFNIVKPHRVYFGAKDYQQGIILKRLTEDLQFDMEFYLCPTVREKDGMAMSSRNRYLSHEERKRAVEISKALFEFRDSVRGGDRRLSFLIQKAKSRLQKAVDKIQYFEVVNPQTLEPLKKYQPEMVILTACFVGKTRLIDNVIIGASIPKKK